MREGSGEKKLNVAGEKICLYLRVFSREGTRRPNLVLLQVKSTRQIKKVRVQCFGLFMLIGGNVLIIHSFLLTLFQWPARRIRLLRRGG